MQCFKRLTQKGKVSLHKGQRKDGKILLWIVSGITAEGKKEKERNEKRKQKKTILKILLLNSHNY